MSLYSVGLFFMPVFLGGFVCILSWIISCIVSILESMVYVILLYFYLVNGQIVCLLALIISEVEFFQDPDGAS